MADRRAADATAVTVEVSRSEALLKAGALPTFLLESAGHMVLRAIDAEAGLGLARAALPDLILIDIQLPGMDGLHAAALLKGAAATRSIPVIAHRSGNEGRRGADPVQPGAMAISRSRCGIRSSSPRSARFCKRQVPRLSSTTHYTTPVPIGTGSQLAGSRI